MANRLIDRAGTRVGMLTVIRRASTNRERTYWVCICDCNPEREVEIRTDVLDRTKGIRNCGCWKREKAANLARKPDEAIGYMAAHDRVRKARGNAREHPCATCSQPAVDWALKKDAQTRRVKSSGPRPALPFSPNPSDYQPMCRSCHAVYDKDLPWRPQPRVVNAIRQKILNGEFPVGRHLPRIEEIASEHGVGRSTAHRALNALTNAGFIERINRRYVVANPNGWWRF